MSGPTQRPWEDDQELFSLAKNELFTAVVGDILDRMGLLHQFLPPEIAPLDPDMVVIGRAMTVLEADVITRESADAEGKARSSLGNRNPAIAGPFGLMLRALDDLKPNEVYLCTGASPTYALWGELMSTRAMKLGAAGAVVNGYSRDTRGILALGFPTFSTGRYAQDQGPRGKVVDFRVPVAIGAVEVHPGDIVFGDMDGVLVVPRAAEEEAFARALEKARGEQMVQAKIKDGMPALEAFETYGIM